MPRFTFNAMLIGCLLAATTFTSAGPLDPDCDAEKAAKSAAMKATVGVGGRCTPKEALEDTARDAVGIEEKGPLEKQKDKHDKDDKEGLAKKAVEEVTD